MESERAELDRLRKFVQEESPGAVSMLSASVHCRMSILKDELLNLTVSLTRTQIRDLQASDGCYNQIVFTFRVKDSMMRVFPMLVACLSLTELNLRFSFLQDLSASRVPQSPENGLVLQVFSVVCRSRSLSSLGITFSACAIFRCDAPDNMWRPGTWRPRYHVTAKLYGRRFLDSDLPILLRNNPCFERLTLTALEELSSGDEFSWPERTISYCFTRNFVPRSWTLTTFRSHESFVGGGSHHDCYGLQEIISLFTTVEQGDLVKELVLKSFSSNKSCEDCLKGVADLVRCNTKLEKLEARENLIFIDHSLDKQSKSMANALRCNYSLKELGYRCTLEEFKMFVSVFLPDAYGRQANTSLSTLKLSLLITERMLMLELMTSLEKLLGSNTTLKHVELSVSWLGNGDQNDKELNLKIRAKLERMLKNELSRNTCLQTLCVESPNASVWRLSRVGTGSPWEMKYKGPCLLLPPVPQEGEYDLT